MAFWKARRMIQDNGGIYYNNSDWYAAAGNVGAPTYLGQPPYIGGGGGGGGVASPPTGVHLGPLPHMLNADVLASRMPSSPDSPAEGPTT